MIDCSGPWFWFRFWFHQEVKTSGSTSQIHKLLHVGLTCSYLVPPPGLVPTLARAHPRPGLTLGLVPPPAWAHPPGLVPLSYPLVLMK